MNFTDFRNNLDEASVGSANDPMYLRKLLRGAKASVGDKQMPVSISRVMKGIEIFNRTGKTQSIPKAIMPHYQAYMNKQQNVASAFASRAAQVKEEVESVEEGVATAQKVMDRANVVAKTNPDPKKRFAASGLAHKAMLRTINPTGVNTGIVRGGGNKTYRKVTGKVPPYQLTPKTGVSEEIEQIDERNLENKKKKDNVVRQIGAHAYIQGVKKNMQSPKIAGREVIKDPKLKSKKISDLYHKLPNPMKKEEIELSEADATQAPTVIQKSVDPPPALLLKRTGIRIFPDGRRVAVYTNSKLGLVFSVPYDAYQEYKPGATFGGGSVPGVQVK